MQYKQSQTPLNVRQQEMPRTRTISSALWSQDHSIIQAGRHLKRESNPTSFSNRVSYEIRPGFSRGWCSQVTQTLVPVAVSLVSHSMSSYQHSGHLPSLEESCHDSHLCPRGVPSGERLTRLLLAWLGQEIPLFLHPWSILHERNLEICWVMKDSAAQQQ